MLRLSAHHLMLPVAAAAAVVLSPVGAFAADTLVPVGQWFTDVLPFLELVAGILVGGAVGLIAWGIHRLIGVTLDAKFLSLLHDTLLRAAQRGLDAVGKEVSGTSVDVHSQVLAEAIAYARTYSPKLLARFGLTDDQLADLIRVHLAKLLPAGVLGTASAA